jgi:hypothetical protein
MPAKKMKARAKRKPGKKRPGLPQTAPACKPPKKTTKKKK